MPDVMVDLETLGSGPGCIILSIGAAVFDPVAGEIGARFYRVVNADSCRAQGLTSDPDTLRWWDEQTEEARAVLREAEASPFTLAGALADFSWFLRLSGENVERRTGIVDTAFWFNDRWDFCTESLSRTDGAVDDEPDLYRIGKKAAGRHLDGRTHDAFPERTA